MQKNWRIKDLLQWTTKYFTDKGIEEPRLEAEVLLAHILKKNRVYLYTDYDAPVNQKERDDFRECIKRRVNCEPLAYIIGCKEFMSLEFKVSSEVLIPRPETELLVETVLGLTAAGESVRICDVGTGSGAIAVSLGVYHQGADICATDLSPEALKIAGDNAVRHNVTIDFRQGDLLLPFTKEKPFDIIVANLPYIPADEYRELASGIIDYEPIGALLASGDGLDLYRKLVPQAYALLVPGGYFIAEIAYNQGEKALDMVTLFDDREIIKDFSGHDRLLKARKE